MSRAQALLPIQRANPDLKSAKSLTEHEQVLLKLIRSKTNMGMWSKDMQYEAKLTQGIVRNAIKTLLAKKLIKEVENIQNKPKKHYYIASEYEPSANITGGDWYQSGDLDKEFIDVVKRLCISFFKRQKVATVEGITNFIRGMEAIKIELKENQIKEILNVLVLENDIMEVTSNGFSDDFLGIPIGKVCYKLKIKRSGASKPKIGALASIPCGVCPQIFAVRRAYRACYNTSVEEDLAAHTSGNIVFSLFYVNACIRSPEEIFAVRRAYRARYNTSVEEDLAAHTSGNIVFSLFYVKACIRSPEEIFAVRRAYRARYNTSLEEDLAAPYPR